MRRNFIKLFSVSVLSLLLLPYKFLYAVTKKIINQNLTDEQSIYFLMKELSVHLPVLYYTKKEMVFITVPIVMLNYSVQIQNMIVEQVGHHLPNLYPAHLKLKLIIH